MEYEKQALIEIDKSALTAKAAELSKEGFRLVQICCVSTDVHTITYTFDKEYVFQNYRMVIAAEDPSIPSITESYLCAFTYENELQDLFGLKVEGLKLNFNGTFYKLAQKTPYAIAPACADPTRIKEGA